ncbi:hypothetical protein GCM10010412_092320 [Nonomuraea recticatena]|uniref:Transposase n=1 Tax=Nonomuraea recticatena TaxID=46178 RepID=A0ABP6FUP0_9ACTN
MTGRCGSVYRIDPRIVDSSCNALEQTTAGLLVPHVAIEVEPGLTVTPPADGVPRRVAGRRRRLLGRTRPDAVAADKAYSSRGNRADLRRRGIKAVIPEKRDQAANRKKKGSAGGRPVSHDADLYKERPRLDPTDRAGGEVDEPLLVPLAESDTPETDPPGRSRPALPQPTRTAAVSMPITTTGIGRCSAGRSTSTTEPCNHSGELPI